MGEPAVGVGGCLGWAGLLLLLLLLLLAVGEASRLAGVSFVFQASGRDVEIGRRCRLTAKLRDANADSDRAQDKAAKLGEGRRPSKARRHSTGEPRC